MEKMKSWLRVWREAMVYERDFKDRGLDNVKLQVLHANFAPEKDNAARRWIRRQETFYLRIGVYISIVGLFVSMAVIYFKK
jgi:hypothetical protein